MDIVADTYSETSIKSIERKERSELSKVLIKSLTGWPANFENTFVREERS